MVCKMIGRREFNQICAAFALALSTVSARNSAFSNIAMAAGGIDEASNGTKRTLEFRDGTIIPVLGQGSWHLAQGRHPEATEEEALRKGLSLGMTLIDTSEGYSNGRAEELIGHVVAGQRDRVFLISKVDEATEAEIVRACEASLARLNADYLDLYLLHWRRPDTELSVVVTAFENLRRQGRIRAWGVSNFQVSDMEDLFRVPNGDRCATNQVRYNLNSRGIENDLLPWCEKRGMPVMVYSTLGGLGSSLLRDFTLAHIAAAHECSPAAVALAWTIRSGHVIAIAESGSVAHVKENAVALSLMLTPQELETLDATFPMQWADILRSVRDRGKRWLRGFLRNE